MVAIGSLLFFVNVASYAFMISLYPSFLGCFDYVQTYLDELVDGELH